MKRYSLILLLCIGMSASNAQDCDEFMEYVKSKSYGTTYHSYLSEAISKVTFYEVSINHQYHYFAIVCFKRDYSGCSEYLYQVVSSTKFDYSRSYINSAGKAFWKYIQPYNE